MINPTAMSGSAAATAVRSSLEEMLDSLRQRDEKPKDVLPALPSRPPSKGRLPSARRSLPVNFKDENAVSGTLPWSQEKEREEKAAVLNVEILAKKRIVKLGQSEESPYFKLPEFEGYEEGSEKEDVSQSPAPLSNSAVKFKFNENFRSDETMDFVFRKEYTQGGVDWNNIDFIDNTECLNLFEKFAALENARQNTIARIVWVQKHYRHLRARRHFQELKQAAIIIQSFTRGYLARRNLFSLQNRGSEKLYYEKINGWDTDKNLQERKDFLEVQALCLAEVQKRALQAEAMLKQKEDECATLREKLHLIDIKLSENDIKLKAQEELWQKQMISLQMSLEASKATQTCGRQELSPLHHNNHNYDLEDGICTTMHTPDATPPRQHTVSASTPARDRDNPVGLLTREFEHRMQVFEDDARNISQLNPEEELRKLKTRFYAWKKDFKARLRERKVALRKSGASEGDKNRKRWWVKRAIRI